VIGHGIDSEGYTAREQLPDEPSILFLANLEYRKGIFTLLAAFDRVAATVPGCTLQIWGTGSEAAGVDRRIQQSPFKDRIHRRGHAPRERVSEIMRSHSVYCMPSHGEPFGMTLLEAMASGVPVVTTDCGGPPHILHKEGGRVVPMRDAGRLAGALIEIMSNVDLQRSMGLYNRRRIEEEFDWSRSLDRMESVYERVLSEQAGPTARDTAREVSV
jgi:glycosyltransferase involved in cell wall biosynthesis